MFHGGHDANEINLSSSFYKFIVIVILSLNMYNFEVNYLKHQYNGILEFTTDTSITGIGKALFIIFYTISKNIKLNENCFMSVNKI